ncbi:hypothetical protein SMICM304S_07051 [Streptomyces microflavus]
MSWECWAPRAAMRSALLRQLGGVPLGAVGQLGLRTARLLGDLGGVGLLQRRQLGGVRFFQRGDLVGVARGQLGDDGRVLGGELLVVLRSVKVITAPTSWSPSRTGAVVRSTGTWRRSS